jgi:hypothetical protein
MMPVVYMGFFATEAFVADLFATQTLLVSL